MKKIDASVMKQNNLHLIRQVMRSLELATKPQLASLTGLSVVTVNSLVKHLLKTGELIEDNLVASNGGRPAIAYQYHANFQLALSIYIREKQGKEMISAAIINLIKENVHQEEMICENIDTEQLLEYIGALIARYPNIKVIGVGIPGQVVNGEIKVTSHRELSGFRIVEQVQQRFRLPVIIENDVNAAIYGFASEQQIDQHSCTVGLYFPSKYPPGMGIYMNGNIYTGKDGMAGEIKYLPQTIDWYKPITDQQFMQILCELVQTICAILAPHSIVVYQDRISNKVWEPVWHQYQTKHQMVVEPELQLLYSFEADIKRGLIKRLVTELDLFLHQS